MRSHTDNNRSQAQKKSHQETGNKLSKSRKLFTNFDQWTDKICDYLRVFPNHWQKSTTIQIFKRKCQIRTRRKDASCGGGKCKKANWLRQSMPKTTVVKCRFNYGWHSRCVSFSSSSSSSVAASFGRCSSKLLHTVLMGSHSRAIRVIQTNWRLCKCRRDVITSNAFKWDYSHIQWSKDNRTCLRVNGKSEDDRDINISQHKHHKLLKTKKADRSMKCE